MPAQATVWGRRWLLAGAALGDAAPAPAPDTGPAQARHRPDTSGQLQTPDGARQGPAYRRKGRLRY